MAAEENSKQFIDRVATSFLCSLTHSHISSLPLQQRNSASPMLD